MNLETKITIYKFTPQVFTLTHLYCSLQKKRNRQTVLTVETVIFPKKYGMNRRPSNIGLKAERMLKSS